VATGARIYLRHPLHADQGEFLDLRRASAEFHRPWDPLPPPDIDPFGPAAFEQYLLGARGDRRERLLLCRRADERLLGSISVNETSRGVFQNASLGYWIGAPFARRGYMTEGLELALCYCFESLGLHRVEANIRPENAPSIALVRRLGFRLEGYSPAFIQIEGRWCDHERWALLADEWRARQRAAPPEAEPS
jgi:ribosomal-protein-alanine N-acetyltransferase